MRKPRELKIGRLVQPTELYIIRMKNIKYFFAALNNNQCTRGYDSLEELLKNIDVLVFDIQQFDGRYDGENTTELINQLTKRHDHELLYKVSLQKIGDVFKTSVPELFL